MTKAYVFAAVEGPVDEVVVGRLVKYVGAELTTVYGRKGKPFLRERLNGFNHAAEQFPWVVLVDLDLDYECAPRLVHEWLPRPAPRMCFRVVVRKVEAWLMADREQMASFLGVSPSLLPRNPESLRDPRQALVALAARSRKRGIRVDMVPSPDSRRSVGPAYASRLIEFVRDHWRVDVASESAPSLSKSIRRLRELVRSAEDT